MAAIKTVIMRWFDRLVIDHAPVTKSGRTLALP
jgi:hypothetical protein